MRVLFVDEDYQVSILHRALEDTFPNDKFVITGSLRKAKAIMWQEKFDVLVIDLMMPADNAIIPGSEDEGGLLTGLKLIEACQTDDACVNRNTPAIILTALPTNMHPDIEKAKNSFGDNFVQKPVRTKVFYKKLCDLARGVK